MPKAPIASADLESGFDPGIAVSVQPDSLSFKFGDGVFGPTSEMRRLDAIRPSLSDPACSGPDPVYGIAMDVGKVPHRADLERRYLLYGVVAYAAGQLGHEPVRSQGHIHAIAPHSGWSTPELFEIWEGSAVIYAQEFAEKNPGRCVAVAAGPGDQVVVPPGWAHCARSTQTRAGEWCLERGASGNTGLSMMACVRWAGLPGFRSSPPGKSFGSPTLATRNQSYSSGLRVLIPNWG